MTESKDFISILKDKMAILPPMTHSMLARTGRKELTEPFQALSQELENEEPKLATVKAQASALLDGLARFLPADEKSRSSANSTATPLLVDNALRQAVEESGVDIEFPEYSGAFIDTSKQNQESDIGATALFSSLLDGVLTKPLTDAGISRDLCNHMRTSAAPSPVAHKLDNSPKETLDGTPKSQTPYSDLKDYELQNQVWKEGTDIDLLAEEAIRRATEDPDKEWIITHIIAAIPDRDKKREVWEKYTTRPGVVTDTQPFFGLG